MTPENFTYWLHGFTEISGVFPTPEQWQVIKDHLKLTLNPKDKKPTLFCGSKVLDLYSPSLPFASHQQTCADCRKNKSESGIFKDYFWLCWECENKKPKAEKCAMKDCLKKADAPSIFCASCEPNLC